MKLLGARRSYDCFDLRFRQYAHIRWNVKYDPDNLDQVLAVSDDGALRFMLESKYVQPMALVERTEGDAAELARVKQYNTHLEGSLPQRTNESSNCSPTTRNSTTPLPVRYSATHEASTRTSATPDGSRP